MKTVLIAARARNGVIGNLNTIPWHIPADLQHFKKTTAGHVILMGAKTWESLGCRALPERRHVVVSSRGSLNIREIDWGTVYHASDVGVGLKIGGYIATATANETDLFVIGGAAIYEQTIDAVDELLITEIDREYAGDRFFPELAPHWKISEEYPLDSNIPARVVRYMRT